MKRSLSTSNVGGQGAKLENRNWKSEIGIWREAKKTANLAVFLLPQGFGCVFPFSISIF